MKKIKTYNNFINESLRDKLKGKSKKEILNNTKNLSPEKKLEKGSRYGLLFLVKQAMKEGADPLYSDNFVIRAASQNGHLDIVKELMKDDRVDPSDYNNWAVRAASQNGYLNIVKELLKDERVDPSDKNNFAIRFASGHEHLEIVKELLKDERVINKLSEEELEKYKSQISNINESLKDKLKGKSEKEIFNGLKNISSLDKFSFYLKKYYNLFKNDKIKTLMKKLSKWERGSINTKTFKIETSYGKEFLQGCRFCDDIVPLDNLFVYRQMIGNVYLSLCNCSKCGEYIIFDENKIDILTNYFIKKYDKNN